MCVMVCVLWLGQTAAAGACRAQNILTACLNMQSLQFKKCEYDDWQCKCHGQKKILTCYDNCPDSENRTLQEMQVQIYCAAVNGKEYNSELIDRMTRPAKIIADEDQQAQPTHAPEVNKNAQNSPPPKQTSEARRLNDDPLAKGSGRDESNFSVLNNAPVAKGIGGVSIVASVIAIAAIGLF
ncbi:Phospholipase D1 [Coemansia sp. Benny D160-2]|nr:Phospholipase D1 [Coemansia sp. Benny D160-2]